MSRESKKRSYEEVTFSQDLTSAALSFTSSFNCNHKIAKVVVQSSAAITESITITHNDRNGSAYDSVLEKEDISNSVADFAYIPPGDDIYYVGDEVTVACTNANVTGTVSGKIIIERV